jgi:serine phosphatase RsbU (regulator of sigma subunit)
MSEQKQSNAIIHPMIASIPHVYELILPIKSVVLDSEVSEVLATFVENPNLSALSVFDNQKFIGLLTCDNYIKQMSPTLAEELYAHSTLKSLLKLDPDIFSSPLVVNTHDRINQVIQKFFNLDNKTRTEVLPIVEHGVLFGVIKVSDMILKLFEIQNTYIDSTMKLSKRLKVEVDSAASLQQNLLRPGRIELPGLRGLATLITSSEIGGDYYDYYTVDARWIVMLVGDVSGHGVASGTIVSAAKASVNLLETDREKEPHKILERLSNTILETARQSLLMTMFVVTLDTQTGELRFANAGHQLAYLYRSLTGQLDMLEAAGLPLGKVENIVYGQDVTEMDVGDRLFIYTDAIVEEENPQGECFGYDRLEAILLEHIEDEPEVLRDKLLESFSEHVQRLDFNDDFTIFSVEFFERQHFDDKSVDAKDQDYELVRIVDSLYRNNPDVIFGKIARQNLVFIAEGNFSDIILGLSEHGIRRVLLKHQTISRQLGWDILLTQHLHYCKDDLASLLPHHRQNWEFAITHIDDVHFIIEELEAWLRGMPLLNIERLKTASLLFNKLINIGVYETPGNGRNKPIYPGDKPHTPENTGSLVLSTSIQDKILGISLTDNLGTLTPSYFLSCLSKHDEQTKSDRDDGFYAIWRLSDYTQIRVLPQHQTQICVFLDLKKPMEADTDNGFQFLYHTEILEVINRDFSE